MIYGRAFLVIAQKILAEEEKSYIPEDVEKAIRDKYEILL